MLHSVFASSTWMDFSPEQGHLRRRDQLRGLVLFWRELAMFLMDTGAVPGGFERRPVWLFQLASEEAVGVVRNDLVV